MAIDSQSLIDSKNKDFWDELCGTQLAKQLGITDSSVENLAKFDNFYLDYYPYLSKYLHLDALKGKKVLEVGLGYGTVSQLLAAAGSQYHGLDIASNAVGMVKHRLAQQGLQGDLRVGNMINCPFPDNYFDFVISIGCFHHTGNLKACIEQASRILKKDGILIMMVYNRYSLRQWQTWPLKTLKNFLLESFGKRIHGSTEEQRKAYDASGDNKSAPETEFFSSRELKEILSGYQFVNISRENFDENYTLKIFNLTYYRFKKRLECLDTKFTRLLGLDLYVVATR